MARKTGARGLRSHLESLLLEVMYEIPSRKGVKKCIIDKQHVEKETEFPLVSLLEEEETISAPKEETA